MCTLSTQRRHTNVKLSKSEAAKRFGLSRTTLRKYIREGRIDVEPDGKIDTTSLLSRGFTLDTLIRSTDHAPDHADQFWPVVRTDQFPGHSPGHSPDQLITLLQQQLADTKQELQDAKSEKARVLSIIEGQQRLLEAASLVATGESLGTHLSAEVLTHVPTDTCCKSLPGALFSLLPHHDIGRPKVGQKSGGASGGALGRSRDDVQLEEQQRQLTEWGTDSSGALGAEILQELSRELTAWGEGQEYLDGKALILLDTFVSLKKASVRDLPGASELFAWACRYYEAGGEKALQVIKQVKVTADEFQRWIKTLHGMEEKE